MRISMTDLLFALSTALDFVERDLFGAADHHSKRVAYLSIETGRVLGLSDAQLADLGCAAALHDNALTEFSGAELLAHDRQNRSKLVTRYSDIPPRLLDTGCAEHCSMGERNISHTPFYPRVENVVLYHHENYDGSGPYKLEGDAIPLFARIIHTADLLDVVFDFNVYDDEKHMRAIEFLRRYAGVLFDPDVVEAMIEASPTSAFIDMQGGRIEDILALSLPEVANEYSDEDMMGIASIFARIIDYKSPFTRRHSEGIADKAMQMGAYYRMGEQAQAKLYLAGAFHDLGKLAVSNAILDKPGKLTAQEFDAIKSHPLLTFQILRNVKGIEEVTMWAALHHEKLDGSGYPFGRTRFELSKAERLMGCIDIYQALTEDRPYREGMGHAQAISVMEGMAVADKIDAEIVSDISDCFR